MAPETKPDPHTIATTPAPVHTALSSQLQGELQKIEQIVDECSLSIMPGAANFTTALTLARGMGLLRQWLTDEIMKDIMQLKDSALGFRTDRAPGSAEEQKKGGYSVATVRDCLIEATLRGARPVGNEFNIISDRAYMTKEFFQRRVRELPGLTDLKLMPGVPTLYDGGKAAVVSFVATWKIDGHVHSIERLKRENGPDERIPIRVNSGMGADAIVGKATRKILAAIYARVTGSELTDGDVEDVTTAASAASASGSATSNMDELTRKLQDEQVGDAPGDASADADDNQESPLPAEWQDFLTDVDATLDNARTAETVNDTRANRKRTATEADAPDQVHDAIDFMCDKRLKEIRPR